jgi:sugar O-acyltransferase (sialic acid O-acetyltransferase NeuD family)
MKKIVILGAGGFAREVLWIINKINKIEPQWETLGFIDEDAGKKGSLINGLPVLGDFSWFETRRSEKIYAVCAIGGPKARKSVVEKANKYSLEFPSLIDPCSAYSSTVEIGKGAIIATGAVLTDNVKVGNHSIVNLNCSVGHDVSIGDFSTIDPLVALSGFVKIGGGVEIGAGAVVVPGINVGDNAFVCAGSVVTKNVDPGLVVGGMPARMIRSA